MKTKLINEKRNLCSLTISKDKLIELLTPILRKKKMLDKNGDIKGFMIDTIENGDSIKSFIIVSTK